MSILTYHVNLLLVFVIIFSSTISELFLHLCVFESKLPKKKNQTDSTRTDQPLGEECSWQAIS